MNQAGMAAEAKVSKTTIDELVPDQDNLNKGTERGRYAIERSIRQYGFGRPIVADKNGTILAGNHALEVAGEIGLEKVIVVETTGNEIIVHKRTDLDAADPKARMYALSDNRTSEVNLQWDAEGLQAFAEEAPAVTDFFTQIELDGIFSDLEEATEGETYTPVYEPTQGAGMGVTADTVAKTQDALDNRYSGAGEQDLIEIRCPCCDEVFTVSRGDL